MLKRPRHSLLQRLQLRESWAILFILGVILVNFPFLHIFNKPLTVFGIPLLFLYLFSGWGVSICIICVFIHLLGAADEKHTEKRLP